MASATYDERIESVAPAKAGFSRTGGTAELPLWVADSDVVTAISRILGTVQKGDDGRLIRTLPIAHPQFPWMVATRITSIQGRGVMTQTAAVQPTNGEALNYYALYPWYLFTVEFTHESWSTMKDTDINVVDTTWVDEDGTTQDTQYAEEFYRFTEMEFQPAAEVVTATHGFQKFRTSSGDPGGFTFPGAPRVYVPKALVKIRWHFVPYDYLVADGSPIVQYLGYVNQKTFFGFAPGTLLYVAVNVKRYTPPVPYSTILQGQVSFADAFLCDLEFVFEYADRTATSPPAHGTSSGQIYNDNWIENGHNALPWFRTRNFYYVTGTDGVAGGADTDNSKWVPTYKSFLPEWLFTNPAILV